MALKLYVWSPALTDYTDGIIFALAESPEEARALVKQHHPDANPGEYQAAPQEYTAPVAFAVWGGG